MASPAPTTSEAISRLRTNRSRLGRLLHARDFPMDRFVRNLGIASEVVAAGEQDTVALSERLARAAREFQPPAG